MAMPEPIRDGLRIRRTRRYLGMNQTELARLFHVNPISISLMERGLYEAKTAPTRFKYEKIRIWAYTNRIHPNQRNRYKSRNLPNLKNPTAGPYNGKRLIEAIQSGKYQQLRDRRKKEELPSGRANLKRALERSRDSGDLAPGDRTPFDRRLDANARYYLQRFSRKVRDKVEAPTPQPGRDAGVGRSWEDDLPGEWAD